MLDENPIGTEGFDFLEFTTKDPDKLEKQFLEMGFTQVAKHTSKQIKLFKQDEIHFIINTDPSTSAHQFANAHGPSVSAMGFKVTGCSKKAQELAVKKGALNSFKADYAIPAIQGVGGSLIYFVDYEDSKANYAKEFVPFHSSKTTTEAKGLTYLDHVTHNLHRGNMDVWYRFYKDIFNFKEVRYFDIEGRVTGLKSRAMTSPCGKIRIPLNESSDDQSQIEEFIKDFQGEGIQHIALGTNDIYRSVEQLKAAGLDFLDTPNTYYDLVEKRLPNHGENLPELKKHKILIDGNTEKERKLLLQIFTKNMLGPVFFEIIQRKGDEGFGEGNFKALFESIELDQINRGVITNQKETS